MNRSLFLKQDVARVELLDQAHRRHAGLDISPEDCPLDRGSAPPSRQQRGVDIDAPKTREVEYITPQDLAVGDHDDDVRTLLRKLFVLPRQAQLLRLINRNSQLQRPRLDRWCF